MKKRLYHIDLIEAIAMYMVIISHTTLYVYDFMIDKSLSTYISFAFRTIISTCIPLFFLANGYLLFNRNFDLKKHIIKIVRLILLTFFWGIILMIAYLISSGQAVSIGAIYNGVLTLDSKAGINLLWYMGAIICIYILFPALKALFDSSKKGFIFLTIAFAIFTFGFTFINVAMKSIGVFINHDFGGIHRAAIDMFNPIRGLYGYSFEYFCIGGLLCFYENRIRSINKKLRNVVSSVGIPLMCFLLFVYGVFYKTNIDSSWDAIWGGFDTVFTFCNVIFIYILSLNLTKEIKILTYISKNTLGIYFIHMIFIYFLNPVVNSISFFGNIPAHYIYAFLVLFISLGTCIAIRKIPVLKKLI